MLLVMLLGMLMNSARQVDGKVRMQNAADAASYSGGVVLARGMNSLAFTNHMLCDVFALTAFLREARDRNAEQHVPPILAAWNAIGPVFEESGFPKFEALGEAIPRKVPLEQELVDRYSDWGTAASAVLLPLTEEILSQRLIPEYQRAVVAAFPDIAQNAALEIAERHANPAHGRGEMLAVLWRDTGIPVGGDYELLDRTLPIVDPVGDVLANQSEYLDRARRQRKAIAREYLAQWNDETMVFFDREAKMCQFGRLWRGFTCGQLERLLAEYPLDNVPFVIRTELDDVTDANTHLEENFTVVGVTYWKPLPEILPGLYQTALGSDSQAYAEVRLFVPLRRLVWHHVTWGGSSSGDQSLGGIPGDIGTIPGDATEPDTSGSSGSRWVVGREWIPDDTEQWTLLNQRWTCQIVPTTQPALGTILETPPPVAFTDRAIHTPSLGGLSAEEIGRISNH